jgi:serine/threonine-protein kinase
MTIERLRASLADRYRIERELGAGGMATVYLAQDLRHDRKVAIKVLKPELAAVLGADRFVQEIKTTAALQHPHILPLFDSGQADGFLYYVMPYIEGETLRNKLDREHQFGIAEAVKITTEVADALDYAHRHGVIHRDIKPENILLHDGRPMVADFGIALAVSAAAGGRMTETGLSLGTPHYMSPEQATAEKDITARSDIYSLGSVLYEMLAGEPPHTGASAQAVIMKIIAEPAKPVTALRKAVPPNVAAALGTAIEQLPADRFENARAFAAALQNPAYGAGATTVAAVPGGRPWHADPRSWITMGIAVIAAAAFLLGRGRGRGPAQATMVFEQRTYARQTIYNARWAPDGKTIVYSAAERGTTPRLYVIRPDYPEPQSIGPDSTHLLAVSSTGELAVLVRASNIGHRIFRGTLARMPLGGGSPREVVADVNEADWSPDGARLAITRLGDDGRVQLEYPPGRVLYHSSVNGYLSDIRVSPAGDRVAFFAHAYTRGDDRGSVMVVDTSGTATQIAPEFAALEGLAWERGGRSVVFSGAEGSDLLQVYRAGPGRAVSLALPGPGALTVLDVAQDGSWLVTRDETQTRMFLHTAGASGVQDVSWLGNSISTDLSGDGTLLAFTDQSAEAGSRYAVMVRKTDGSPAVRIGEGSAIGISPDHRLVLGDVPTVPSQPRLYPLGPGETINLKWPGLETIGFVDFFPDGRSLVVCGTGPGKAPRCYRSPLEGGSLEPLTSDSVGFARVRPDGRAVAYWRSGQMWIRPLDGGADRRGPDTRGLGSMRWSPDGKAIWAQEGQAGEVHLVRVDVATGKRTALVDFEWPRDWRPAPLLGVRLADDPRTYAYTLYINDSELFTVRAP